MTETITAKRTHTRKTGSPPADRAANAKDVKPATTPKPTEPIAINLYSDPGEPKGLTPLARKRLIAAQLVKAAADLAVNFKHDDIDRAEARELIRAWVSYLPVSPEGWDERLGQRSDAGRRTTKATS